MFTRKKYIIRKINITKLKCSICIYSLSFIIIVVIIAIIIIINIIIIIFIIGPFFPIDRRGKNQRWNTFEYMFVDVWLRQPFF